MGSSSQSWIKIALGCFLIGVYSLTFAANKHAAKSSSNTSAGSAALPTQNRSSFSPGAGAGAQAPFTKKPLTAPSPEVIKGAPQTHTTEAQERGYTTIIIAFIVSLAALMGLGLLIVYRKYFSPIVTVNNKKITLRDYRKKLAQAVAQGVPDTMGHRDTILNDMILREVIAQDLNHTEYGSNFSQYRFTADQKESVLEIWFSKQHRSFEIQEHEILAEYNKRQILAQDPKNAYEYQLSQIIVRSEREGIRLIEQLQQGVSFSALAEEKSIDQQSRGLGGYIGWAIPAQILVPLNDHVVKLKKNQFSAQPIHTKLGWHIVKVQDIRPFVVPAFETIKGALFESLLHRKRQEAITALMARSKVVRHSEKSRRTKTT